jgi:hypothetical protein
MTKDESDDDSTPRACVRGRHDSRDLRGRRPFAVVETVGCALGAPLGDKPPLPPWLGDAEFPDRLGYRASLIAGSKVTLLLDDRSTEQHLQPRNGQENPARCWPG